MGFLYSLIEPPGAPGQPEVGEVTNNTATLTWDKPTSDGGKECAKELICSSETLGGPITGYWIEKRELSGDKWLPVNINPCQTNRFTVPSLIEDHAYEFRVIAENEAGKGIPSESSKSTKVNNKRNSLST